MPTSMPILMPRCRCRDFQMANVKSMPDVYDAYNLLSNNNLLKNKFEFIECSVDNYTIYRATNCKNGSLES